jgi:thioredoxin 1
LVVDVYTPWCGPCKTLTPRLDQLAGEFGDRIKFVAVNGDQAPELAAKFRVEGILTLLFFGPDGMVTDTSVGLLSTEALRVRLEALTAAAVSKPAA